MTAAALGKSKTRDVRSGMRVFDDSRRSQISSLYAHECAVDIPVGDEERRSVIERVAVAATGCGLAARADAAPANDSGV